VNYDFMFRTQGAKVAKYRKESKPTLTATIATLTASIVAGMLTAVLPAQATTPSESVTLYLSAPFVQGSHVIGDDVRRENFNAPLPLGNCAAETAISVGTVTGCRIDTPAGHGGATADADNANPVLGGAGSNFITTVGSTPITINLTTPVKYVGFWWSAGSIGNTVEFYKDGSATPFQTVTSDTITTLLGTNTVPQNLTNVNGDTNSSSNYFGHPKDRSLTTSQPFTYLNLFLSGVTANKIVFTGSGFEFDNLVTSTGDWGPTGDMVFVSSNNSSNPSLSPQTLSWSPANTSVELDASPLTPSTSAAVTSPGSGGGAITYSVVNAGTTGCSVDPTTGVITRPATGTCVVRASAAAVPGYFSTYVDVSFTISSPAAPPTPPQSSGTWSETKPGVPAPVEKVDPCIAVAGTDTVTRKVKSFSGFAINSAKLTRAMKKQIRTWLNKHPGELCVSITGFTMGPRVLATDPKLARDRARSIRSYIKSLRSDASFTPITSRTQKRVGDEVRRAKVTLRY
jgi:hypothetical protein